jgi:hypothetical protein
MTVHSAGVTAAVVERFGMLRALGCNGQGQQALSVANATPACSPCPPTLLISGTQSIDFRWRLALRPQPHQHQRQRWTVSESGNSSRAQCRWHNTAAAAAGDAGQGVEEVGGPAHDLDTPAPAGWQALLQRGLQFIDQNVMVIMLLGMMGVGVAAPAWGQAAAAAGATRAVTVAIFVIAGLQLRRGEAAQVTVAAWHGGT